MRTIFMSVLALLILSGCGKQKEIELLKAQVADREAKITQLEEQLDYYENTNSSLLDRMADLSIVSKTGAESIKQSLDNLSQQYSFIEDLTRSVQAKDSLNLALVTNLKRSLADLNDRDVQVEVRGGRVHVSISDQLLFASGSSRLGSRAREVLGKIGTILNDHQELDVMVEGHTDNVPINNSCTEDNWDLSVRRATAVVRSLQEDYYVAPGRMTAAGCSEYRPLADNETVSGRAANRRTAIVITPQLDQFFDLLESPALAN
ncbi:MAG: OmpA family protein [Lewinella sp.]|nr:OmpA family protein [Lewinella sp.]